MKQILFLAILVTALFLGACTSYNGVTQSGDKLYISANTNYIFFAMRNVQVCDVASNGSVSNCRTAVSGF